MQATATDWGRIGNPAPALAASGQSGASNSALRALRPTFLIASTGDCKVEEELKRVLVGSKTREWDEVPVLLLPLL